jgi:hypothetical protein
MDRCDAGPTCPHFAGFYPVGDHGWFHRRRPGCPERHPIVVPDRAGQLTFAWEAP